MLLTSQGDLKDSLFLVKHVVPFDVAFSLPELDRKAWVIAVGELNGQVWDYDHGHWR